MRIGDFLIGIVYLAILYTLVRPQSQGARMIQDVSNGLIGLINAATGGGSTATSSGTPSTTTPGTVQPGGTGVITA